MFRDAPERLGTAAGGDAFACPRIGAVATTGAPRGDGANGGVAEVRVRIRPAPPPSKTAFFDRRVEGTRERVACEALLVPALGWVPAFARDDGETLVVTVGARAAEKGGEGRGGEGAAAARVASSEANAAGSALGSARRVWAGWDATRGVGEWEEDAAGDRWDENADGDGDGWDFSAHAGWDASLGGPLASGPSAPEEDEEGGEGDVKPSARTRAAASAAGRRRGRRREGGDERGATGGAAPSPRASGSSSGSGASRRERGGLGTARRRRRRARIGSLRKSPPKRGRQAIDHAPALGSVHDDEAKAKAFAAAFEKANAANAKAIGAAEEEAIAAVATASTDAAFAAAPMSDALADRGSADPRRGSADPRSALSDRFPYVNTRTFYRAGPNESERERS